MPDQPLRNQVAVVAGATRGAGRGIARMLGVGRAVAALAADTGVSSESGGVFAS
jgi:NAD(P)-dependent dehydrogenase (short-subunit alcohol dehydrogenase family)